jgi:hypothetical protein
MPTTGIGFDCARAASGPVTAAPPMSARNARRLIRSPRLRPASRSGGISTPSGLAVVRLTTVPNFVASLIGMSPGFTLLRILSTKVVASGLAPFGDVPEIAAAVTSPCAVRRGADSVGRCTTLDRLRHPTNERLLRAVKRSSRSQCDGRYGSLSGRSSGGPYRGAIRPIEASKAAIRNGALRRFQPSAAG